MLDALGGVVGVFGENSSMKSHDRVYTPPNAFLFEVFRINTCVGFLYVHIRGGV